MANLENFVWSVKCKYLQYKFFCLFVLFFWCCWHVCLVDVFKWNMKLEWTRWVLLPKLNGQVGLCSWSMYWQVNGLRGLLPWPCPPETGRRRHRLPCWWFPTAANGSTECLPPLPAFRKECLHCPKRGQESMFPPLSPRILYILPSKSGELNCSSFPFSDIQGSDYLCWFWKYTLSSFWPSESTFKCLSLL